jgi:hypothetical protein
MSQKNKHLDVTRDRLIEEKNKQRAPGSLEKKVYVF